jgi:putative transport protein
MGCRRAAAVDIQSSVCWTGSSVGIAVLGVLLTVFGYFTMVLAQITKSPAGTDG